MKDLIKLIFTEREPVPSHMPEYIGQSLDNIVSRHPDYAVIPYCSEEGNSSVLEIRLGNSTLSCVIKDNICTEAYQFAD